MDPTVVKMTGATMMAPLIALNTEVNRLKQQSAAVPPSQTPVMSVYAAVVPKTSGGGLPPTPTS